MKKSVTKKASKITGKRVVAKKAPKKVVKENKINWDEFKGISDDPETNPQSGLLTFHISNIKSLFDSKVEAIEVLQSYLSVQLTELKILINEML